jgi:hypothetical protein
MAITDIFWLIVVIVGMIVVCYFTSGISNMAGTVFEKKSTVAPRSAEKSTVPGGRKQSV